jgi:hypothetical protein
LKGGALFRVSGRKSANAIDASNPILAKKRRGRKRWRKEIVPSRSKEEWDRNRNELSFLEKIRRPASPFARRTGAGKRTQRYAWLRSND